MGTVTRDLTGQVLDDRYRVIEPLGEGSFGSVYRGERLKLGRMVAIKVLNEEFPNPSSRERFEREATAMARLEHPNCASVLDVGVHGDFPYVVMELVTGQTLKQILEAGPLPIARAVELTRQVLSGLSHAHEHGIIHRDIKPANIVVSQKSGVGDLVKILDFGLARFRNNNSNLTGAMVIGTPNYMAPEQVCGGDLDHRVDLYACGVLLFELLTGTKPFEAADPVAVCMQHVNVDPPRLSERAPPGRVFGALEDVVARALEKQRDARFANADDFARALVEAAAKLDDTAPNPPALDVTLPLPPTPRSSQSSSTVAPQRPPSSPSITRPQSSPSIPMPRASTGPVAGERAPSQSSSIAPPAASPRRRVAIAIGALASIAAVAIVIVVATRSDAKPTSNDVATPPPTIDAAPVIETADNVDAVAQIELRGLELAASGRREAALDLFLDARKTYPKDARLAYQASKLYLDKMYKADGLKLARTAIDLDPKYKSDDELIKLVVKLFNTTASTDWTLSKFLREDIGPAAKPYLEDTANGHPNPIVRKRAKAELRHYR